MYDVTQMTLWLLNHTSLVPRRAQKASRIWFIFYLFLCRISLSFVWPHTLISQKTWLFLHVLCEVTLFYMSPFWRRRTFLVLLMHLNSTSTCFTGLLHLKRIETDNTSLYHWNFIYPNFSWHELQTYTMHNALNYSKRFCLGKNLPTSLSCP